MKIKGINATFTKKNNVSKKTGTKLNVSEMKTLFLVLSLNARRRSSKEIWPWPGFFRVSLLLADLHRDKILLFL